MQTPQQVQMRKRNRYKYTLILTKKRSPLSRRYIAESLIIRTLHDCNGTKSIGNHVVANAAHDYPENFKIKQNQIWSTE